MINGILCKVLSWLNRFWSHKRLVSRCLANTSFSDVDWRLISYRRLQNKKSLTDILGIFYVFLLRFTLVINFVKVRIKLIENLFLQVVNEFCIDTINNHICIIGSNMNFKWSIYMCNTHRSKVSTTCTKRSIIITGYNISRFYLLRHIRIPTLLEIPIGSTSLNMFWGNSICPWCRLSRLSVDQNTLEHIHFIDVAYF